MKLEDIEGMANGKLPGAMKGLCNSFSLLCLLRDVELRTMDLVVAVPPEPEAILFRCVTLRNVRNSVLIVMREAQSEVNHYSQLSLHRLVCPLVLRIQAPPVEISDDATWQGGFAATEPRNDRLCAHLSQTRARKGMIYESRIWRRPLHTSMLQTISN